MKPITVVIVNCKREQHTINLLKDLRHQAVVFDLEVYDQLISNHGSEQEMVDLVYELGGQFHSSEHNIPLNSIWNMAAASATTKYISFLNNDIRILPNFLNSTIEVMETDRRVDCVVHPTNHPDFVKASEKLKYIPLKSKHRVRQGWDFTVRTAKWVEIPESLEFFCGDDYIFEQIYQRNAYVAYVLNSPILHWQGQTARGSIKGVDDVRRYMKLGFSHDMILPEKYSQLKPTSEFAEEFLSWLG